MDVTPLTRAHWKWGGQPQIYSIFAAQRHFLSSPRRSKLDFEIFVSTFATHFKKVVRVWAKLSGMSGSIIHLPQVHLSHHEGPYLCWPKLWAWVRFGADWYKKQWFSRSECASVFSISVFRGKKKENLENLIPAGRHASSERGGRGVGAAQPLQLRGRRADTTQSTTPTARLATQRAWARISTIVIPTYAKWIVPRGSGRLLSG